jgi:hypothetical protein
MQIPNSFEELVPLRYELIKADIHCVADHAGIGMTYLGNSLK